MFINPYLEAEETERESGEEALRTLAKGVSAGSALLGAGSLVKRLLPLLSEHIPENIAKKGIAKVSAPLGRFVESATNLGHDFYDVRDFLRAKAAEEVESKTQEKNQKAADKKNIIKQYSPQLDQFIMEEIQKGRPPLEAGALAYLQEPFKKIIRKITEDHQTPFSSILQTVYGDAMQPKKSELSREALTEQAMQGQQGGQGKAALLQTMQQMTELLRNMRGNG